jgi:hypothetical protein
MAETLTASGRGSIRAEPSTGTSFGHPPEIVGRMAGPYGGSGQGDSGAVGKGLPRGN